MYTMFKEIKDDLNDRMANYTDSRQPTGDEVRLAWLISEIEELNRRLERGPIKNSISLKQYPNNYVEEEMPQIIVEVRYKKDVPTNKYRREEALVLATKIETFINKIL